MEGNRCRMTRRGIGQDAHVRSRACRVPSRSYCFSGTESIVYRLRFVETVLVVGRQIDRQARKITGSGLMLHDVAVIEIDRCLRSVEEGDIHDAQVVEVCEELVAIGAHLVDIAGELVGINAEMSE